MEEEDSALLTRLREEGEFIGTLTRESKNRKEMKAVYKDENGYYLTPNSLFDNGIERLPLDTDLDEVGEGIHVHPHKLDCLYADAVEYMQSEAEFGAHGVTVPGACHECGARFEYYYGEEGHFDPDTQEYVKMV